MNSGRTGNIRASYTLGTIIQDSALNPRDTSICNKDIEAAVELLGDLIDILGYIGLVGDVDLVGLAYRGLA